jgi:hypothetical protein
MNRIESDVREDIETSLDQIQQVLAPIMAIDPETVKDVDDLIGEIRGNLMLLYTITK